MSAARPLFHRKRKSTRDLAFNGLAHLRETVRAFQRLRLHHKLVDLLRRLALGVPAIERARNKTNVHEDTRPCVNREKYDGHVETAKNRTVL
jgi:hypothetical protein